MSSECAAPVAESDVWSALRGVLDPELDCNVVDLGLIYSVTIRGDAVSITMTLTTAGCPMHESIRGGIQHALLNLEAVNEAQVDVVWDPPWDPVMMSEAGRRRVGWRLG